MHVKLHVFICGRYANVITTMSSGDRAGAKEELSMVLSVFLKLFVRYLWREQTICLQKAIH